MKRNAKVLFAVLAASLMTVGGLVYLNNSGTENRVPDTGNPGGGGTGEPLVLSSNPKDAVSSAYVPVDYSINPDAPQYTLPISFGDIVNHYNISYTFSPSEDEISRLEQNGFVIIDYGMKKDMVQVYKHMKEDGIPVFVTSDSLLHLYHIQFNEILKRLENQEFFYEILNLSLAMEERSFSDYGSFTDPTLKEAARMNTAFFSVAVELLTTPTEEYNGSESTPVVDFTVPDCVSQEVSEELVLIENHSGFEKSPIFHYKEDYSQYVPRGHYTETEKLRRYFKAMMWYGRLAFLMKGGEPHGPDAPYLISEEDARNATIAAAMISEELNATETASGNAGDIWKRIYAITSFFVGVADDLTPYEYMKAVNEVFNGNFTYSELLDNETFLEFKEKLLEMRSPAIYGGTGACEVYSPLTDDKLDNVTEKTKGMRFMGQRYVPDSYMFTHLTLEAGGFVGKGKPLTMEYTDGGPARCFPRGLDVMAVLGSHRALQILENEGDTDYRGLNTSYMKKLSELRGEFSGLNETEWNRNLYFSWIYTLKSLIKGHENYAGYPVFMQTKAWDDKELNTALGSWAELRHDTILYAKQSYTPHYNGIPYEPPEKPVVGYVEPVPEFYARMLALTEMTERGLKALNALSDAEESRLKNLEDALQRLLDISKKELENQELSDDDYKYIRNFSENIESTVLGVNDRGTDTRMVADVHTDQNTNQVLEEGVGYVNLILVAYKVPDGRIIIGAGPVFSYYEFKQPMDDRLTDEEWRAMLDTRNVPGQAEWLEELVGNDYME